MKGHLEKRVFPRLMPDPESDCLLWTGAIDAEGYGRVWDSRTKKQSRIHVLVWELENGPVPPGMEIDHVKDRGCRYRHCGNLAHLEPVTHAENMARRIDTHCIHGHEKTPENTYVYRNQRACRTCKRSSAKNAPKRPAAQPESLETIMAAVRRETAKRKAAAS